MLEDGFGYFEGEPCGREGCTGTIREKFKECSCSCHISAPCAACETPLEYCDTCDWDAEEEKREYELACPKSFAPFKLPDPPPRDPTKVNYTYTCLAGYWNQIRGSYPEGMSFSEALKTFGFSKYNMVQVKSHNPELRTFTLTYSND